MGLRLIENEKNYTHWGLCEGPKLTSFEEDECCKAKRESK